MEPEKKEHPFTLVKKQQVLELKQPLQKVLGFAPMFNNTFVIMGIKTLRYENVAHYDAEGTCLKEHVFHDSNLYPYIVPSDRQIIWVDADRNLLLQWNLQNYQLLEFPFSYNNDTADSHEVFFFPKTKLICIGEWGRHDSNFLRFTYFKYPLRLDSKPECVFERENVWNYEYTIRRANTTSKFVWWKCAMVEQIQLRVFELVEKDGKFEGKYTQHKCKNSFESAKDKICQLSVGCIWQMTPNKYLIVSITDRPHTKTEYPNSLFVYEEDKKLFREAKFAFEGKFRFQYIHYYNFGRTSMIRSFDFLRDQPLKTPVYYIDNVGQQIATIDYWKCSHLNKFTLPGYDADVIIDAEYENGDVSRIKSTTVKIKYDFPQKIPWSEYLVHLIDGLVNQDTIDLCEETYNLLKQDLIMKYKKEYQMQVQRFKTEI